MATQTPSLRQPFTSGELKAYGPLFKSLDKEGLGIVTGDVARPLFEKSGLPTNDLRDIWQLADAEGNGFLTEFAFLISLRLIGHCQHGATPSAELLQVEGPIANLNPAVNQAAVRQSTGTPPSRQVSFQTTGPVFPPLSAADVSKFSQLFARTAPNGVLNGDAAKSIFLKANLPTPTLGQIWNLVDREQSGQLSQQEFIIAMYLIQNTINGSLARIPQFIPSGIWDIAAGQQPSAAAAAAGGSRVPSVAQRNASNNSVVSSSTGVNDWVINSSQKQQYETIFDSLDKNKTGVLSPNEIAQFLMTSNLPQETLGAIWDLADVENSGEFTKREFNIALYLVNRKLAGGELPNIVPESLIHSASSASQQQHTPQQSQLPQQAQQSQQPVFKPQSSINDLASLNDLFSSPVVTPTVPKSTSVNESSKQPLATSATGARVPFVPSSNFGQQMASEQAKAPEPPSLLEDSAEESDDDDEAPISAEPISNRQRPAIPSREQKPHFTGDSATGSASSPANYDALKGFSSQPSQGFTSQPSQGFTSQPTQGFSSQPAQSRQVTGQFSQASAPVSAQAPSASNNDLLADSEVSGQLSQATTDIANISNQINSLTTQTTHLNDKRERATGELNRILALKKDIESKLTKLRVLYDQEVKQVQEVESVLLQSKQETESLRKETTLIEANYHATQAKLQQLQVQYEESQKESEVLKGRLGELNAENAELNNQHAQLIDQHKQSLSMLSVTQQQVNVAESKNVTLRGELEKTNKEVSAVEEEHEVAKGKLDSLKAEIPMLTAAISAAVATVAMTKSALKGTNSTIDYHSQQKQELEAKHQLIKQEGAAGDEDDDVYGESASKELDDVPANSEETKAVGFAQDEEEDSEGEWTAKSRNFSVDSPVSNTQAASSTKPSTETPVSSPEGSDFQYAQQYQNFNLPLGRPQSTSSSVANNPPLSVRGEEDVSEPASSSSIDEEIVTSTAATTGEVPTELEETLPNALDKEVHATSQSSSTGESFELVEAENDDAHTIRTKNTNEQLADNSAFSQAEEPSSSSVTINQPETIANEDQTRDIPTEADAESTVESPETNLTNIPGAFVSFQVPSTVANGEGSSSTEVEASGIKATSSAVDEEFPPIKELDYDEEDSSDDEDEKFHDSNNVAETERSPVDDPKEQYDDALDKFTEPKQSQFDEFDDLQPAVVEQQGVATKTDDLFDEFDGLQEAQPESNQEVSAFEAAGSEAFSQGFSDSAARNVNFDSFDNLEPTTAETNNDEWEQLFEGFGNSNTAAFAQPEAVTAPQAVVPASTAVSSDSQAHDLAIQELTGMGFDQKAVVEALKRENWNLENATNHLLDSA